MKAFILKSICYLAMGFLLGKILSSSIDINIKYLAILVLISILISKIDTLSCANDIERTEKKLEAHIDKLYKNGILPKGDKND